MEGVLVVFAGDGRAESTLPGELAARGVGVIAIDVALGGEEHDVRRPPEAASLLGRVRAGRFTAVFAAPPCLSFSVAHRPALRSRTEPGGLREVPH
eukprot:4123817-Pleurochrysis_carterae.AAC.1